ncbi:MAG: aldose 1-epimerase [Cytophagales bacterium]
MYSIDIAEKHGQHIAKLQNPLGESIEVIISLGGAISNTFLKSKNSLIKVIDGINFECETVVNEYFEYKGSFMFPFVNRLENGTFYWNKHQFKFDLNENNKKNALHGLFYNQPFTIKSKEISDSFCRLNLQATTQDIIAKFPFLLEIEIAYTLTENYLKIETFVKNIDTQLIPFCLGWHPYFNLENDSILHIPNCRNIPCDENLLPIFSAKEDKFKNKTIFLDYENLDHCFEINASQATVELVRNSTDSRIKLDFKRSDNKNLYFQVYQPSHKKTVALEPQTSFANSLNHQKGITQLEPQQAFSFEVNIGIS